MIGNVCMFFFGRFIKTALRFILILMLSSCGRPETIEPKITDLVGKWKCETLPHEFLKSAGVSSVAVSNIIFNADGTYIASSFPQSSPHRLQDTSGKWVIVDPSMTPSGKWSIEVDGNFLQLKRKGDSLFIHQAIDVLNAYNAEFEKENSDQSRQK